MRYQRYGRISAIIYRWLIDPLVQPLRPRIVSLCLKHGVNHVLDIGCATGAQCRLLGVSGIHAVGLDLSEAMIASATTRSGEDVEFVLGSAYELPFADNTFGAAILSLALHEHSEQERSRMLAEALRAVREDGYLIIAEYAQPQRTLLHLPWRVIQLIEAIAGAEHHAGFREFVTSGGLACLLRRHDLKPVEMVYSHFHTVSITTARNHTP